MYEFLEQKSLSVVVPIFNEENFRTKLLMLNKELKKFFKTYEIIVISDGSRLEYIEDLQHISEKNIRIYHCPENKGKGNAIKIGVLKSTFEYICFIDGGMELNPKNIKTFMVLLSIYKVDAVIGSKRHPFSQTNYPWYRKLLSFCYQGYISILLGLKFVKDSQVGIKLFKSELLKKIISNITTSGYAFDIELLALASKFENAKILEAPIELKVSKKHKSTRKEIARLLKISIQMALDTLKIVYRVRLNKRLNAKEFLNQTTIINLTPQNFIYLQKNAGIGNRGRRIHRNKSMPKVTSTK